MHKSTSAWTFLVASVLCEVCGLTLMKWYFVETGHAGSFSLAHVDMFSQFSLVLLVGAFIYLISPFFFAVALSRMDISTAYPVKICLVTGLILIGGVSLLGETLTLMKVVGVCFLTVSTYLFSTE